MLTLYTSTITEKGQATIPAPIRAKLKLKPGQTILFEAKDENIIVKNPNSIIENLYGSIKTNIKWDKKKAYEAVGKMLAEKDLKSHQ